MRVSRQRFFPRGEFEEKAAAAAVLETIIPPRRVSFSFTGFRLGCVARVSTSSVTVELAHCADPFVPVEADVVAQPACMFSGIHHTLCSHQSFVPSCGASPPKPPTVGAPRGQVADRETSCWAVASSTARAARGDAQELVQESRPCDVRKQSRIPRSPCETLLFTGKFS